MRKTLLCALFIVAVAVIGIAAQSKLFVISGDETSITITFTDAASKQVFLDAMAARGSYREERNTKGEVVLTEEFVFNELIQMFGETILQQRTRAAIEAAVTAIPKDDIPDKKPPKAAAVKP